MPDKRIKVVHILEGFLGGTSTYICTVLPELVRRGFDVTLIGSTDRCCPDAQARISKLRASGVKVHIIAMCREISLLRDVRSFVGILRLLLREKFDIVHTHCSKAGALGRVAAVVSGPAARLHTPHCFAFMRCGGRVRKSLYYFLERVLGGITTRLVAVSYSEALIAARRRIVPIQRTVTVRNGLSNGQVDPKGDSPEYSVKKASLGLDEDTRVVTTACRLVEYKGILRFLRAAKLSRAADVVFLIAGEGRLRASAERYISENGLNNKVRLLGHVPNMQQVYAISDVVALCSDAEGQPYLLLEAMRAKCPIVATSVVGNRELISHNRTGLLADPTPGGIARAVDEMLADEDRRHRCAENAYDYFSRYHALKTQISHLTQLYAGFR
jgi:glycosyltransferase involved in cell wall biosynthesis